MFPPEFPAPTFLFRDTEATSWIVEAAGTRAPCPGTPIGVGRIDPRAIARTNRPLEPLAARTWTPDAATWAAIKKPRTATVTI